MDRAAETAAVDCSRCPVYHPCFSSPELDQYLFQCVPSFALGDDYHRNYCGGLSFCNLLVAPR